MYELAKAEKISWAKNLAPYDSYRSRFENGEVFIHKYSAVADHDINAKGELVKWADPSEDRWGFEFVALIGDERTSVDLVFDDPSKADLEGELARLDGLNRLEWSYTRSLPKKVSKEEAKEVQILQDALIGSMYNEGDHDGVDSMLDQRISDDAILEDKVIGQEICGGPDWITR